VVRAHGVPSTLLLMLAAIPLILWAARVFHRCCEAPSMARAARCI
jgi:hypothetical protein